MSDTSGCAGALISVIVPVYKTGDTVEKCVASLMHQTYTNLEIILVDDGSPDECPQKCDNLAKRDERIKVIHKKNGGLSDARNYALEVARGDYIGFVDSDDYVDEDMYEIIYNSMQNHQAEIGICGFVKHFSDGSIKYDNSYKDTVFYIGKDIINTFLKDDLIGSQPCNKLFARRLFDNIRFPKGRVYEDVSIMHEVFCNADGVVCLPENKYHYNIHESSISFTVNSRWHYSLFRAFADRYLYTFSLEGVDGETQNVCLYKTCNFALSALRYFASYDKEYIYDVKTFLKDNIRRILKNPLISVKKKIKVVLFAYFYSFTKALSRKGKNNE